MLHLLHYILVVDKDVFVRRIEQVAKQGNSSAGFLKDELWSHLSFLYLGDCILPSLHQNFQFGIKFSHPLAFSHRADDYSVVFGLDAVDELLESGTFLTALNL